MADIEPTVTAMTPGTVLSIMANALIAVLGVFAGVSWPDLVGPDAAGWVVVVVGVVNAAAHAVTGYAGGFTKGELIAFWANIAVAVLGFLQGADWVHLVTPHVATWIVMGVTAVNAALHTFTGIPKDALPSGSR